MAQKLQLHQNQYLGKFIKNVISCKPLTLQTHQVLELNSWILPRKPPRACAFPISTTSTSLLSEDSGNLFVKFLLILILFKGHLL